VTVAFPIKLDDDRTLRGTDAAGTTITFDDYLHEGETVGLGEIPEDCEDRDPRPPYGKVVRKEDGLWVVERTDEEERARTQELLRRPIIDTPEHERAAQRLVEAGSIRVAFEGLGLGWTLDGLGDYMRPAVGGESGKYAGALAAFAIVLDEKTRAENFLLTPADVKLLTGDLSDYDGDAEKAMEAVLVLDQKMRDWLADNKSSE
jgi:hypothetical protein